MVQVVVCCLLLVVARVQAQRQVFRTELFPEQLQQQQVQLMQRQIQDHLQFLQTQAQAATTFDQQVGWSVLLYLCLCVPSNDRVGLVVDLARRVPSGLQLIQIIFNNLIPPHSKHSACEVQGQAVLFGRRVAKVCEEHSDKNTGGRGQGEAGGAAAPGSKFDEATR